MPINSKPNNTNQSNKEDTMKKNTCVGITLSKLTKTAQRKYQGTLISSEGEDSFLLKHICGKQAPWFQYRDGLKLPVCKTHNKSSSCLVRDGGEKIQPQNTHNKEKQMAKDQEIKDKAAESRVMSIIEAGEPGVHKPEDDFIIAGTGSRSLQTAELEVKNFAQEQVMTSLKANLKKYGKRLVVESGMAEGFDKLLAKCAIELGIRLWCVIPNRGYGDYYWARNSLTGQNMMGEFNAIVEQAWKVTYVLEDVHNKHTGLYLNGRHSNFIRNDFMVETANAFLVWDPSSRGTSDCFASIQAANKPYRILNVQ